MKILVLEPYFGGSHETFLRGLERHIPADLEILSLPARKWKWRMRLAAPWFAEQLQGMDGEYSSVLCSSFVDVAALKAFAPGWIHDTPVITYFHENQFAYPVQKEDERDFHFALTNYTTALASDKVLFNSLYNRETFLAGCRDIVGKAPDMPPDMEWDYGLDRLRKKCVCLPPGIDFSEIDQAPKAGAGNARPVIVWNHRWEHDKNPEPFFESLFDLDCRSVDFGLVVMGQSFQDQPAVFARARQGLARRIMHFGTVSSRKEYAGWLRKSDVVVSTATHEFFGMAVLEAVRAGCRPLLPNRLSYPENYPEEFLYDEGVFTERLIQSLEQGRLPQTRSKELTERFSWSALADQYADILAVR